MIDERPPIPPPGQTPTPEFEEDDALDWAIPDSEDDVRAGLTELN